jgi:hypothetical protein
MEAEVTTSARNDEIQAVLLLDGFVGREETALELSSGSVALGASFNPLSAAMVAGLAFTIPVSHSSSLPGWLLALSTEGRALLVSTLTGPLTRPSEGVGAGGVYFDTVDPSSAVVDLAFSSPIVLRATRGEALVIQRHGSSLKLLRYERQQETPSLKTLLEVEDPALRDQIFRRLDSHKPWEEMIAIGTFLRLGGKAEVLAPILARLNAVDNARWKALELESTAMTWVITSAEEALRGALSPPIENEWHVHLEYLTARRDELESMAKVLSLVGRGKGLTGLLASLDRRVGYLVTAVPSDGQRPAFADPWLSHIQQAYDVRWFSSPEG